MKENLVNCIKVVFIGVLLLIALSSITYAAGSFSISASTSNLTVGQTTTLTISVSGAEGKFSISSSDNSVATVNSTSEWVDGSKSITITSKSAGTATITVTASDVSSTELDANGNVIPVTGSKTATITVKEPVQEPVQEPETPISQPENPTTEIPTTNTKSSNNNLKSLKCSAEGLTPAFNKNTTTYALNVGNDVENITVEAQTEDSKATVTVTGNTELVEGQNTIKVVVKAENGSTKTYTINAIKPAKQEILISTLEIKGINKEGKEIPLEIIPDFKPQTFNYGIETEEDITELEIKVIASLDDAVIKIEGNKDLKDGINTVKIILHLPESQEEVVEYKIVVNKMKVLSTVTTTGIDNSQEGKTINIPKPVLIGAMVVSFIGIGIVIYIYNKPNNKKLKEDIEVSDTADKQKSDTEVESKASEVEDKKSGRHF